jgi:hypothetical protein
VIAGLLIERERGFTGNCYRSAMTEQKAVRYRQRAEECFHVARQTKDEGLRKQYRKLGHCYLELADAEAALMPDQDKTELSRPAAQFAPPQQQRGDGSGQ